MIPVPFEYYKPANCSEANDIYNALISKNKMVFYYAGGSEIITMSRTSSIVPNAIIDLKDIPETQEMKIDNDKLIIGSNVTLSRITDSKLFPLLGTTAGRIADHTNQNRITLGGNVCGRIIYRESVLPLLLSDADIEIFSNGLKRIESLNSIFNRTLNISENEFAVRFIIDRKYINLPFFHVKKTQNEKIDYPLITVCALRLEGKFRIAFSGLTTYPFRSLEVEDIVNDNSLNNEQKVQEVFINTLPVATDSIEGSKEYKMFVLKNTILDILNSKEINDDRV